MDTKTLIEEELSQAGEPSPISPLVVELDKFRIMSDTDVPPEEFLMRLFGKPCFPRRDLSAVTGLEKCGKTFFTSMLMACCTEKNVLELERISEEPLRVMWYDTEQSRQSTRGILANRVFKLIHPQKEDPDAMSGLPSMGQEALQDMVMSLAGIRQAKYYDKVFQLAMDQRVVQTTMDRNGRIVAILIPS